MLTREHTEMLPSRALYRLAGLGEVLQGYPFGEYWTEYAVYISSVIFLASLSCLPYSDDEDGCTVSLPADHLDENLAAETAALPNDADADEASVSPRRVSDVPTTPPMIYYSAAGSGVAEVRVILSGCSSTGSSA